MGANLPAVDLGSGLQAVALAGAITTLDSDTSVKPEAVDPKATLMTALTD
jgi:hypothetical protein